MWLTLTRLALFVLSSIGYWEYFRKKTKITLYFLPAFTVSFQVIILYIAGLLNCLKLAAIFLFATGLIFAVYYTYRNYKTFFDYCNIGFFFFFLALGMVLLAVRGHVFSSYDNFSHWALVVRNMLQTDRYPNFEDTLIIFQEYPLGSATFIYYFSKVVSKAESIQMLAQGYMMVSFLLPVFKYAKKWKGIILVYMILFTNFIFCYNTRINGLLVDTLLSLQGAASWLFIFSEVLFNGREEKEKGVSILCAIPFLCTSMQIKNSGIYFVAVGCTMIIIGYFKAGKRIGWGEIFTVLSPFLSLYFWKTHCSYMFSAASVSKHAMTAENYKQVYSLKTAEDIKLIIHEMFQFSVSGKALYCLIVFLAFTGILVFYLKKDFCKKYFCFLAVSVSLYFIYVVGMTFMYLFSMPGGEAVMLAGADRYRATIFIVIYYLFAVVIVQCISETGKNYRGGVCGAVMIAALIVLWRVQNGQFTTIFEPNNAQERLWFETAIHENSVGFQQSYMVCISADDGGYAYYLCKYLLYSDNITVRIITDGSQTEDFQNYNYVFFYDSDNEILNNWVSTEYPEQTGKSVITTAR